MGEYQRRQDCEELDIPGQGDFRRDYGRKYNDKSYGKQNFRHHDDILKHEHRDEDHDENSVYTRNQHFVEKYPESRYCSQKKDLQVAGVEHVHRDTDAKHDKNGERDCKHKDYGDLKKSCDIWNSREFDDGHTRGKDKYYSSDDSSSDSNSINDYKRRFESSSESDDSNPYAFGASGTEIIGYKTLPPHHTIMLRNLPEHITSRDILQEFVQNGITPKDIRLITNKKGASRRFAFIEFPSVEEATRCMETYKGVFTLQHQYKSIMQYGLPTKSDRNSSVVIQDWFCAKCYCRNFNWRIVCFQCHASRMVSEIGGIGTDEISSYKTKTIMLRNLDVLTTVETITKTLEQAIPNLLDKITAVEISRDQLTSTSRGICYLETNSIIEGLTVFNALDNQNLRIDGKRVILSFCKYHMGDPKHAYDVPLTEDVNVNTNTGQLQLQNIFTYNRNKSMNQMDSTNSAAAVAQSAIQQRQATKAFFGNNYVSIPSGVDGKRYPTPDITTFIYDANSEYYYDPQTGLYYNHVTHYFWNNVIQKYLYWDYEKSTYLLAPPDQVNHNPIQKTVTDPEPKMQAKIAKQSEAQRIAKTMEKWVKKKCNQKKISPDKDNKIIRESNSEYSILKKDPSNQSKLRLVSIYKSENESSDNKGKKDDVKFLDFATLICNLCKRKLPNEWSLKKHAQTETHQHNLLCLKTEPSFNNLKVDVQNQNILSDPPFTTKYNPQNLESKLVDKNSHSELFNHNIRKTELEDNEQTKEVLMRKTDEFRKKKSLENSSFGLLCKAGGQNLEYLKTESLTVPYNNEFTQKKTILDPSTICIGKKLNPPNLEFSKSQSLPVSNKFSKAKPLTSLHKLELQGTTSSCDNQQNLELLKSKSLLNNYLTDEQHSRNTFTSGKSKTAAYRDRALERRLQHGHIEEPPPSKLKERFSKSRNFASPEFAKPIDSNNVGNKLLQKMGWSEGQGLGKFNQGRTSFIQTEQRIAKAGLGTNSTTSSSSRDSYRENGKKKMYARYRELFKEK